MYSESRLKHRLEGRKTCLDTSTSSMYKGKSSVTTFSVGNSFVVRNLALRVSERNL